MDKYIRPDGHYSRKGRNTGPENISVLGSEHYSTRKKIIFWITTEGEVLRFKNLRSFNFHRNKLIHEIKLKIRRLRYKMRKNQDKLDRFLQANQVEINRVLHD